MPKTHPHAEATYRVIPLEDGSFGVEVSIPENYPTTVKPFGSEADAARNLAHALGITVYIRDGRIYQHGPGIEVLPPPGAHPTAPGAPYAHEEAPAN